MVSLSQTIQFNFRTIYQKHFVIYLLYEDHRPYKETPILYAIYCIANVNRKMELKLIFIRSCSATVCIIMVSVCIIPLFRFICIVFYLLSICSSECNFIKSKRCIFLRIYVKLFKSIYSVLPIGRKTFIPNNICIFKSIPFHYC